MPIFARLSAYALLVAVSSVQAAGLDAKNLMQRMSAATEQLNYDGIFVYQRGAELDTMRILHKFDGGIERERLVALSGPAREVIRDGSRVTCLFADDREVMVENSEPRNFLSSGLTEPIENLSANYTFKVIGSDRTAARATTVIMVTPKQGNRYSYQLWLDDEFGLLLKSVILARGGKPLEQVQFTRIVINAPMPDALFKPEIAGEGFTWYSNSEGDNTATAVVETSGWLVNWLPDGFQMRNYKVQPMHESDTRVSHMVYSDGLAMVSVFVEALPESSEPLQGFSSLGAVNAFSRIANQHQITVVGEIPLPIVRQIASSVERQQ